MKIAITSIGNTLDSTFEKRFGRSPYFIIYDTDTKTHQAISNDKNLNAVQGAGVQSARNLMEAEVKHLITGHCGPKAFYLLQAAGIKIYATDTATVQEAIDQFNNGSLTPLEQADVESHWA